MSQDPRPQIQPAKCCATCKYTRITKYGECKYGVKKPPEPKFPNRRKYDVKYLYLLDLVKLRDLYPDPEIMHHDNPMKYSYLDWMSESEYINLVSKNIEEAIEMKKFTNINVYSKLKDLPSAEAIEEDTQKILQYAKDLYKYSIKLFEYKRKMIEDKDNILLPRRISGLQVCGAWEARK